MAIDMTVRLLDRPGTLAQATDALGRAGVNIEAGCGYICEGVGVFHLMVQDAQRARHALIDAGFEIAAERRVVLASVENRPGAGAELLRRVAAVGANVDLLYLSTDGQLVLSGPDVEAIERVLA
jgi:hypothetical protein